MVEDVGKEALSNKVCVKKVSYPAFGHGIFDEGLEMNSRFGKENVVSKSNLKDLIPKRAVGGGLAVLEDRRKKIIEKDRWEAGKRSRGTLLNQGEVYGCLDQ